MIGGAEVSPFTIEAARDMLRQADRQKQGLRTA